MYDIEKHVRKSKEGRICYISLMTMIKNHNRSQCMESKPFEAVEFATLFYRNYNEPQIVLNA